MAHITNFLFVLVVFFPLDSETLTNPQWSKHVETFNGKTFHLVYEPLLPWADAVQACKEKNLVLAKIDSIDGIPDLSEWPFYRKQTITKVCSRGAWIFYREENFRGFLFGNYSHTLSPSNCQVKTEGVRFPLEESLSLRYVGAKNTSQESVSFFTQEYFQGTEYVTDPVTLSISGINETINSIVFTGYTNWTFFEDVDFNGSDRCFENKESRILGSLNAKAVRPKDIDFYGQQPLIQSRLKTVGSASNNCRICRTEVMG